MTDPSITPGPEGLRALSHPLRLRMLGMLRTEGPATATTLAERLGLNTGATSYHLRQLAQHGFIEDDAERGSGRERWWRAAHRSTRTHPDKAATPEEQDTFDAFLQSVAVVYSQTLQHAVEERRTVPPEWQAAGTFSDWEIRLTPERAGALTRALEAVVEEFREEVREEATDGLSDAQPFVVNVNTFLRPGGARADDGSEES